ncbi:MAG: hypothetical protein EXQ83_06895 [Xanthobacteraceae bacterium]|nr:hypothetical protein [Xanthobacteraceae bacterium]
MSSEQQRTDASGRERSPDHQYSLSIEATAELYAEAGHPRTIRAVQKYCALSKLDCHKVETETGEKYLVAPYSVTGHIAYINEVRTVANGRDQTRPDMSVCALENKNEPAPEFTANNGGQPRPFAIVRGVNDRYVSRLESENDVLRAQMEVKDTQIKELTERARETNTLTGGLQKTLSPLLSAPGDNHRDPPMPK